MDRRETERLLELIRQARVGGDPAAIATIVRVHGSAYRREGARMFVRQDGSYECALSGGCLEPTVAEAAARVIATGVPAVVSYDLADDSIWGLGIGCSGAVDIRIERVEDDPTTRAWLEALDRGAAAVLVTRLSETPGRMLVVPGGDTAGGLGDPVLDEAAAARAREHLRSTYPRSSAERVGDAELFFDVVTPPPSLVLFGAGDDAASVAQLGWTLGFAVTVVDVREAMLTSDRFANATAICAHFDEFAARVRVPPGSFVVVMNHHIERDRESLRFGLESEAAYIGVLGPRSRYQKLLAGLAEEGDAPAASRLSRVRNPVGLALGAETPREVAVSIVGEILAVRRGFEGGFLDGEEGSLHRPEDKRLIARS
jgi:xanthine dehydrogenase accessory factor